MADFAGTLLDAYSETIDSSAFDFDFVLEPHALGVVGGTTDHFYGAQADYTGGLPNDYDGVQAYQFDYHWLHKVHVFGAPLSINASSGDTTDYFYMYNTVFGREVIAAINIVGDDTGIAFDINSGDALSSLQYKEVEVVVDSANGPLNFDVDYTFVFDEAPNSAVSVSGFRVEVWAFDHQWGERFTESMAWATNVLVSLDGTEQRRALSLNPRVTYSMAFLEKGQRARDLRNSLYANMAGRYMVPLPHSVQLIAAALPPGVSTLPYTHETAPVQEGGYLFYRTPAGNEGLVQVSNKDTPGEVDLVAPTLEAFPKGTTLRPAVIVQPTSPVSVTTITDQIAAGQVSFVAEDPSVTRATYDPDQGLVSLGGKPVFDFRHNWANDRADQFTRVSRIENYAGYGSRVVYDRGRSTSMSSLVLVTLNGASEIARFQKFLRWCRGRARSFWMRSEFKDLTLVGGISSGANSITVRDPSVAAALANASGNRLAIFFHDYGGRYYYAQLTGGYTAGTEPDTFVLSLSEPATFTLAEGAINRIGFCYQSRLDNDVVLLNYITDTIAECEIPLVAMEE